MRKKTIHIEEVKDFINSCSDETKVYLGTDSQRFRKDGLWYAEYATVVVVHIDGCRGCRIFGEVDIERDFDSKKDRPTTRLLTEVQKVSEMFQKLKDVLADKYVEVHIDINGKKEHNSNLVLQQAVGYVTGMTNIKPKFKPDAWAATHAADHVARKREYDRIEE